MHTLVTGAIGSGKTSLSLQLGSVSQREVVSLDAIYFDLDAPEHRKVREVSARLELLRVRMSKPRIFEGWHFGDWLIPLYHQLSAVIIVDTPLETREQRIRDRFTRRKAGLEPDPFPLADEHHLHNLLKWTRLFSPEGIRKEILQFCPAQCEFHIDDGFGSYLSSLRKKKLK